MKHLLLALLLAVPTLAPAQTARPYPPPGGAPGGHSPQSLRVRWGSAYAYHSSEGCAGLNRCSHGVTAVTVAESMGSGHTNAASGR